MRRIFLTATLVLCALPLAAQADCHHRRLNKVFDRGHTVELDDGSQWAIADMDQDMASNWLEDATITACDTELINTEDHETAQARQTRRGELLPDAN